MDIDAGIERVARWLNGILADGRPCPTNLVQSFVMVLDCSRDVATEIKARLIKSRRLVVNPIKHIYRFDGEDFSQLAQDRDEVSIIKAMLRKHFKPVFDPRTVNQPEEVAEGTPEVLIVGGLPMTYSRARAIALELAQQQGNHHAV